MKYILYIFKNIFLVINNFYINNIDNVIILFFKFFFLLFNLLLLSTIMVIYQMYYLKPKSIPEEAKKIVFSFHSSIIFILS